MTVAEDYPILPDITDHGYKRIMRRKPDAHFARICHFFDLEERRCTIYQGRPAICREFPGTKACGYYDFLNNERGDLSDAAAARWKME